MYKFLQSFVQETISAISSLKPYLNSLIMLLLFFVIIIALPGAFCLIGLIPLVLSIIMLFKAAAND